MEKTNGVKKSNKTEQDHLHIRGENKNLQVKKSSVSGSPPHTWRKRVPTDLSIVSLRITSTYVEKTPDAGIQFNGFEDHLHIRGENLILFDRASIHTGSPPHTWRKRFN